MAILLERAGRNEEAEQVLCRAAATGNADMLHQLVAFFTRHDRTAEAAAFVRGAVRDGVAVPVPLLVALDLPEELERALRAAARRGELDAMKSLSQFLERTGRTSEAAGLLERAATAGDTEAAVELTKWLCAAGKPQEARSLLEILTVDDLHRSRTIAHELFFARRST